MVQLYPITEAKTFLPDFGQLHWSAKNIPVYAPPSLVLLGNGCEEARRHSCGRFRDVCDTSLHGLFAGYSWVIFRQSFPTSLVHQFGILFHTVSKGQLPTCCLRHTPIQEFYYIFKKINSNNWLFKIIHLHLRRQMTDRTKKTQ